METVTSVIPSSAPEIEDASQPPDWATLPRELHCPLCEYNLRGLTEARCPECGHRFNWRELEQERDRQHPYLFEHHRRRNVWSFFRTLSASLRPRRFWVELQPLHRPNPRRLVIYWLGAATL